MSNKNLSQTGSSHIIIIAVAILTLVSMLGFTYWNSYLQKNSEQKAQTAQDTRPDADTILTLDGKVTMKINSCGAKSIYPDEDLSRYAVCDSGKGLRIGNKIIYTSSGGPGSGFSVNTDSINLGDIVSARYIVDENYGGASLNCSGCSVTVIKSAH